MTTIQGTDGNDFIYIGVVPPPPHGYNVIAESGTLNLILPGAGDDIIYPSSGDIIDFGANFDQHDQVIARQGGFDTIELGGNYSSQLLITGHMVYGVGIFLLDGGFDYNLKFADAVASHNNDTGSHHLRVDASAQKAGDTLVLNAAPEKDYGYEFRTGAGTSTITGGQVSDTFESGAGTNMFFGGGGGDDFQVSGGTNTLHGGAGGDIFQITGAAATMYGEAGDDYLEYSGDLSVPFSFDGGAGHNSWLFDDTASGAVHVTSATIQNVQSITLMSYADTSHAIDIVFDEGVIAPGRVLSIGNEGFPPQYTQTIDGSAVTDARFAFNGTNGIDTLTGGAQADTFTFRLSAFSEPATFVSEDRLDGGAGNDTLIIVGDYANGVVLAPTTIQNIEKIQFGITGFGSGTYAFTTDDANVAAGVKMLIDGSRLDTTGKLLFDGSHETDGRFNITGGFGDDVLTGGAGADTIAGGNGSDHITGGLGGDHMTGGSGKDAFFYGSVHMSTGVTFDTIEDFSAANDSLALHVAVNAIDTAVTGGVLTGVQFDTQLAAAVGASQLAAHDAVLFTPDSGAYAGRTFLVVDWNGVAGYQAGHDLVICLGPASDLTGFSAANFT